MGSEGSREVTRLLAAWSQGDRAALEELTRLVYEELRRLAHRYMAGQRADHTLQTTALVNEAYLRLAGQDEPSFANRSHFLAVAAKAMRQILVDHARSTLAREARRGRQGRGTGRGGGAVARAHAGDPRPQRGAGKAGGTRCAESQRRRAQLLRRPQAGGDRRSAERLGRDGAARLDLLAGLAVRGTAARRTERGSGAAAGSRGDLPCRAGRRARAARGTSARTLRGRRVAAPRSRVRCWPRTKIGRLHRDADRDARRALFADDEPDRRRPDLRPLGDPEAHRQRRHGRGLSRPARRPAVREAGRDQAHQARHGYGGHAAPLSQRAADPRRLRSPEHRATARRRHDRRRPAVLRHGVRRGAADRRVLRPASARRHRRGCSSFARCAPRSPTRIAMPSSIAT